MVIYFKTKKLQKVCSVEKSAVRELGSDMARKLQQRMMELRAAVSLADIPHTPPQRRHLYTGDREGQISVDLKHPYRLIFVPVNDPVPLKEDGGVDMGMITEIEIVSIEDPH